MEGGKGKDGRKGEGGKEGRERRQFVLCFKKKNEHSARTVTSATSVALDRYAA